VDSTALAPPPPAVPLEEEKEEEEQQEEHQHVSPISGQVMVVGIAGGSGSGKTTLALALHKALGKMNCAYLTHDSYYKDMRHLSLQEKEKLNFDHPDALDTALLVEHIQQLKRRKVARVPTYDFSTHSRLETVVEVEPRTIVLVEGILLFSDPALVQLMDLKVFVDTDCDIRLIRRIRRDTMERGRTFESVIQQYTTSVRPMYNKYVKPSMSIADLVVPHGMNSRALECILSMLRHFLYESVESLDDGGSIASIDSLESTSALFT